MCENVRALRNVENIPLVKVLTEKYVQPSRDVMSQVGIENQTPGDLVEAVMEQLKTLLDLTEYDGNHVFRDALTWITSLQSGSESGRALMSDGMVLAMALKRLGGKSVNWARRVWREIQKYISRDYSHDDSEVKTRWGVYILARRTQCLNISFRQFIHRKCSFPSCQADL